MRVLVADRGTGEPISLGANLLAGKKVAPDVTSLLAEDHRTVLGWFDWYEAESDQTMKRHVALSICDALDAHMDAEEKAFYPLLEAEAGGAGLVEQAYADHQDANTLIKQIRADSAGDAASLVLTLRSEIENHVLAEEGDLFLRVRQSGIDLFEAGREVAARRADRMLALATTGKHTRSTQYEVPKMTISPDEARDLFIVGLRNAHATASQCKTMVEAQVKRLENYPQLEARLQAHLKEKDRQLERLETILEGHGESRSSFKDAAMSVMASMSSTFAAMADDEIIKNSFTNFGMANFEAAAYETLLVMGEAAGETAASLQPLQQSLSEERAMVAFIAENLRPTAIRFMQLRSEGEQASH